MIDLVRGSERDRYPELFGKMFRLRHEIFKERLGWDVNSVDGMEFDHFDDLDPVYFLALSPEEDIEACWRLLPTTGPNMLRDTFSFLLDGGSVPEGRRIWEASRFAVSGRLLEKGGLTCLNRVTAELLCALCEFGAAEDIDELVTVYEITVSRLIQRMGCRPKWVSRRHRIGPAVTIAAGYEISPAEHQKIMACCGIQESVLRRYGDKQERKAA